MKITSFFKILNRKIERSIKVDEGSSVTPDALIEELKEAEKNLEANTSVNPITIDRLYNDIKVAKENINKTLENVLDEIVANV